ncbi:hypothetical protein Clacol_004166 [Clathrus columnatus]|uniref:Uncharacterized protein n=1 Tax=Clathrus columnatus TaxID=1419009 RepID=A0AAV5A8T6_9AGAM|nr:hypothetical protein Clacol_004166 [Clathrus columnatus]
MSSPFPPGAYKIVNYENGNINAVNTPSGYSPVVADSESAIFTVSTPEPKSTDHLGFHVHHLVNIRKEGRPANLSVPIIVGTTLPPGESGRVVLFDTAVPSTWCIHSSNDGETNKYLIYSSRYGTTEHGPCHWHLESSKKGTNVIVNADQAHPINVALRGHISAGSQGEVSLNNLTQKLKGLEKHHSDCFWHFYKQN